MKKVYRMKNAVKIEHDNPLCPQVDDTFHRHNTIKTWISRTFLRATKNKANIECDTIKTWTFHTLHLSHLGPFTPFMLIQIRSQY